MEEEKNSPLPKTDESPQKSLQTSPKNQTEPQSPKKLEVEVPKKEFKTTEEPSEETSVASPVKQPKNKSKKTDLSDSEQVATGTVEESEKRVIHKKYRIYDLDWHDVDAKVRDIMNTVLEPFIET